MKDLISNKYLTFVLRVIVGFVFCYAAVHKIIHIDLFARDVYNYQILPGSLVNLMAVFLPMIEMLAGIGLILGIYPKGSTVLIAGMLIVFIVALAIVLSKGIDFNCGCFSHSDRGKSDAVSLIIRDTLLLLACAQIFFFGKDFLSIQKLRQ